jgi:hypothetical protein
LRWTGEGCTTSQQARIMQLKCTMLMLASHSRHNMAHCATAFRHIPFRAAYFEERDFMALRSTLTDGPIVLHTCMDFQ